MARRLARRLRRPTSCPLPLCRMPTSWLLLILQLHPMGLSPLIVPSCLAVLSILMVPLSILVKAVLPIPVVLSPLSTRPRVACQLLSVPVPARITVVEAPRAGTAVLLRPQEDPRGITLRWIRTSASLLLRVLLLIKSLQLGFRGTFIQSFTERCWTRG